MIRRSFVLALGLSAWSPSQEEIRCTYTRKVECTDLGRCEPTAIGGAYLLIPQPDSLVAMSDRNRRIEARPPQLRRCDSRGCTAVDVSANYSGDYVNINALNGGYFLKIAVSPSGTIKRGEFVESATFSLATVTYWGSCSLR